MQTHIRKIMKNKKGSVIMTNRKIPKSNFMLLGSSCPYPWLILEENGR